MAPALQPPCLVTLGRRAARRHATGLRGLVRAGAVAGLIALASATVAASAPEGPAVFEGPPHLLWREGGATAVLLARGRIRGAMARITPEGRGEIVVPGATFDRRSFAASVMPQAGLPGLKLSETADGAVRIEVSGYALDELEPRIATAPARLLLRIGGSPRREEIPASEPLSDPGTLAPEKTPAQGNIVVAALPSGELGPTPEEPAFPRDLLQDTPAPATHPMARLEEPTLKNAPQEADAQDAAALPTFECRWRRLSGFALCAPDPMLPAYRATPELAAVATALGEAQAEPPPQVAAGQIGAAAHYLAADREVVAAGTTGYAYGAVALYERALRLHPDFADAPRGGATLLLLHRTLGFRPELEREARRSGSAGQGLALALVGELELEDGHVDEALDGFRKAVAAGGIAKCVGLRGQSRAELARGRPEEAHRSAATLPESCPSTFLEDPASEALEVLLDANAHGAGGVAARLVTIAGRLAGREQDEILQHAVRVAAADNGAAGEIWQEIARRGAASGAGRAAIEALARRDALAGDAQRGFARLAVLPPSAADAARRRVELSLAGAAIDRGAYAEGFGQLVESGAAMEELSDARARALRDHLDRIGVRAGGASPGGDPRQGLDASGFAVTARTAALAGFGPETLSNTRALASLDPGAGAALALELGEALAVADPGVALDLVALTDRADPRARWLEARVAAGAGETARALLAYEELARSRTRHPFVGEAAWRGARLAEAAGRTPLALELYRQAERSGEDITRRLAVLGRRRLERTPGAAAAAG